MRFAHQSKQHSLALSLKENILGAIAAAFQSKNSVRPSACRDSSIFLEEKCMIWKFVMINRIFSIIKIYTKVKNLTFRMWWHSSIHPSIHPFFHSIGLLSSMHVECAEEAVRELEISWKLIGSWKRDTCVQLSLGFRAQVTLHPPLV